MGFFQAGEVPALNGTGGSLTLAGTDDVYLVTDGEGISLQNVTTLTLSQSSSLNSFKTFFGATLALSN